jgi:hypothetical protein
MVAGRGIVRNYGRNNNSPGTGARYLLVCGRCALNRDNRVRLVPALGTDCAVLKQDKAKPFLVTSRAVTRESGINNLLFFRGQYRGTHWCASPLMHRASHHQMFLSLPASSSVLDLRHTHTTAESRICSIFSCGRQSAGIEKSGVLGRTRWFISAPGLSLPLSRVQRLWAVPVKQQCIYRGL